MKNRRLYKIIALGTVLLACIVPVFFLGGKGERSTGKTPGEMKQGMNAEEGTAQEPDISSEGEKTEDSRKPEGAESSDDHEVIIAPDGDVVTAGSDGESAEQGTSAENDKNGQNSAAGGKSEQRGNDDTDVSGEMGASPEQSEGSQSGGDVPAETGENDGDEAVELPLVPAFER